MAAKKTKSRKLKDLKVKDKSKSVSGGRDPASGLPTGKRMHKPFVLTNAT